uniref:Aldo-keto reductase family 4 member C10 n=1 Tax=Schistocephalus solidus TaxID=70667 RepID=A0A0X3NGX4_SCHSO
MYACIFWQLENYDHTTSSASWAPGAEGVYALEALFIYLPARNGIGTQAPLLLRGFLLIFREIIVSIPYREQLLFPKVCAKPPVLLRLGVPNPVSYLPNSSDLAPSDGHFFEVDKRISID